MIYIIIGIIITVLVLILLSFLLIPLNLSLDLKKSGSEIKGKFSLIWLGIVIFSKETSLEKDEGKQEKTDGKDRDKKEKFDSDRILKILNLFIDSLPYIYRLIVTLYTSFALEKLSINVTMGMESPVDTSLFTGWIWSVTYPLNALTPINVVVRPDFNQKILDGNLEAMVKLKLGAIVVEIIRAFTKEPVRKLINEIRS